MTMSACERESSQDERDQDCQIDTQDFKSNINKAVNNVLEGSCPHIYIYIHILIYLLSFCILFHAALRFTSFVQDFIEIMSSFRKFNFAKTS